jgi:polyisoprenoid-binding protein YceI
MIRRAALLFAALAVPALSLAEGATWNIDPAHTRSGFTVRHLVISNVRGEFGKTTGKVVLDEKDPAKSSVEATIDVNTLDTRVPDRDAHLRSADFFDVAKYPTITFRSTKVHAAGKGKLEVTGDLTMKGVTKPVVLHVEGPSVEVKGPMGDVRRAMVARTVINRREFGLNWSKAVEAGPVVGDDVQIEIEAEMVKAGTGKQSAAK